MVGVESVRVGIVVCNWYRTYWCNGCLYSGTAGPAVHVESQTIALTMVLSTTQVQNKRRCVYHILSIRDLIDTNSNPTTGILFRDEHHIILICLQAYRHGTYVLISIEPLVWPKSTRSDAKFMKKWNFGLCCWNQTTSIFTTLLVIYALLGSPVFNVSRQ